MKCCKWKIKSCGFQIWNYKKPYYLPKNRDISAFQQTFHINLFHFNQAQDDFWIQTDNAFIL